MVTMTRPGRSFHLTADQQAVVYHVLDVVLTGETEWGEGEFQFDDEAQAERMLAAALAVRDKLDQ